jgi:hypothetical protein
MPDEGDRRSNEGERTRTTSLFALASDYDAAERAVRTLHDSGCNMSTLSVIGRDYYTEQGVVGFAVRRGQTAARGNGGGFWARLSELTDGTGFLLVPGIGPVFIAGPVVGTILVELENVSTVGGMHALNLALYGYGVPLPDVAHYEASIRAGTLVLIAQGSEDEVRRVREMLPESACSGVHVYSERA